MDNPYTDLCEFYWGMVEDCVELELDITNRRILNWFLRWSTEVL